MTIENDDITTSGNHNFYTNFFLKGENLCLRKIQDGERILEKIPVCPTLYIPVSENKKECESVYGHSLASIKNFSSPKDAKDWARTNKENVKIFGFPRFEYTKIHELYPGVDGVEYDFDKLKVAYIDIEVEATAGFPMPEQASDRVNLITLYCDGKYVTFGLEKSYKSKSKDKIYVQCDTEKELLNVFLDYWSQSLEYPDIITGWNSDFFDIPYLVNRIERVCGRRESKRLSPWGNIRMYETEKMGRTAIKADIDGVESLDYMDLYRTFTYTQQESYKLDYIAHVELGERKLDYSEMGSFRSLYTDNWKKYVDYNIQDVGLIVRLEEKMKLIELATAVAYFAKVNYQDVFWSVRMWDVIIANYVDHTRDMKMPYFNKGRSNAKDYGGGYVKDPLRGRHNWTCSFDLTSLYPSLIQQYNISPDTLDNNYSIDILTPNDVLEKTNVFYQAEKIAKSHNLTLCSNGAMFSKKKKGFLPELMEQYFVRRKDAKTQMLEQKKTGGSRVSEFHNKQMAIKILMNACYGCIGSPHFRLYDERLASGITMSGQVAIQWVARDVNNYLQKMMKDKKDRIVAIDTDSIYVEMDDLVSRFWNNNDKSSSEKVDILDSVCSTKMQDTINRSYERFADLTSAYENHMEMKREAIGHGIFVQKKRYTMYVFDNEGVRFDEPELKIMGLEAVRSTTPEFFRNAIKDVLKEMYLTDEKGIIQQIKSYRKKFDKLPLEDIATTTGISDKLRKYEHLEDPKGTPGHMRAAIAYNRWIKDNNLSNKYEMIKEADKIKIIPLKEPNPLHVKAIGFGSVLPPEMELSKYIDKDAQFQKMFIGPLERVLNVVGWKSEESVSLEDFFT